MCGDCRLEGGWVEVEEGMGDKWKNTITNNVKNKNKLKKEIQLIGKSS